MKRQFFFQVGCGLGEERSSASSFCEKVVLVTCMVLQFSVQLIFFGGISPAGRRISPAGGGIYPSASGKNLDFCRCTIPTVGFYGKLGEIASTHHIIRHPRRCRRRPPPPLSSRTTAVVSCRHPPVPLSTCCHLLHGGGKACQYFWQSGLSRDARLA